MKTGAILPAAGSGRRMGGVRKAFMEVAGKPMLQHCVEALLAHPQIQRIVVALSADDVARPPAFLQHERIVIVAGGAERADSVRAGMSALPPDFDVVLVHDAARPLIDKALIDRVLAEVARGHSASVGVPLTDTLHEVSAGGEILTTPDRSRFWRAQTPQAFPRDVLESAFAESTGGARATDEAGLVAAAGYRVHMVEGADWNTKVTTPEDIAHVEAAFRARGQ